MVSFPRFRFPKTSYAKLFAALLTLVVFFLISVALIAGFLVYHILEPPRSTSDLNIGLLMGQPSNETFALPGGGTREGLFFPGLNGAPTVILCHGYRSQRTDVLPILTSFQQHGYNVFLFDFTGHGASAGTTTLGYREAGEVLSAIQMLAKRTDVDRSRFGAWGTDLGAYSILIAATTDARIRSLAVASVYDSPRDLLVEEVNRSGLEALPMVVGFSRVAFRLLNYSYRQAPTASQRLAQLHDVAKLFIVVRDRPELAEATQKLFDRAPEPKRKLEEKESYAEMSDEARRAYENQILNFFLETLPPAPGR